MTMFLIALCYVSALPEAFKLISDPAWPVTESATDVAERSPGAWSLQAE